MVCKSLALGIALALCGGGQVFAQEAASLVGIVLWFVVDALTAKERPTPWRR